jgi:type 1 glutamine amidotransferase
MVECIERGRKQMPIVWVGERGEKPNHVSKVEKGFLPSEESN